MPRIKQAVCYPIFLRDGDVKKLFPAVARIGFAGVETWQPGKEFADVCRVAADNGLVMVSITGGGRIDRGPTDRSTHEQFDREVRASLDLAVTHRVPNLIILAGQRMPGLSEDAAADLVAAALARVAPAAVSAGVNLNLELLNSKVDHPGYQCDHAAWGMKVVEKVNSPRVKLLYDIYHMQIMEGDLVRTIRACIGRIGHFHTAGNPGRHNLDDGQELNYRGICSAIAATEYAGYVSHEFQPTGDLMAALRQAYEVCDVG